MNPAYFETHFEQHEPCQEWPKRFAIITAFATTGERWSEEKNRKADRALESELRNKAKWMRRLTGYSPSNGHAEPGWAVEVDLKEACDIGRRYHQDAIYYVENDRLSVSFCDGRSGLVEVGTFSSRVDLPVEGVIPS